jgi:UDP-glucuronate 4-epimerase
MRILITGYKGYIGSALYKKLKTKHTVIGIDIKDGEDLLTCMLPINIDLVIHLAGLSGVRESLTNPGSYWINNVEASRRIFERYPNTRILYASSSSAYEPDLNPYAASKYIVEEIAARHNNNCGMRFHTVYSNNARAGMFVSKLLQGTLEYTTAHYRDFIHLEDVLDAIEIIMKKTHVTGIVDIGTGVPIKISNLAPDLPIRLNTPGERTWTCANTEKMRSLGFKPKYNIEKFLTENKTGTIIKLITEKI